MQVPQAEMTPPPYSHSNVWQAAAGAEVWGRYPPHLPGTKRPVQTQHDTPGMILHGRKPLAQQARDLPAEIRSCLPPSVLCSGTPCSRTCLTHGTAPRSHTEEERTDGDWDSHGAVWCLPQEAFGSYMSYIY